MVEENRSCCGSNCGCHVDMFPTARECPNCRKRLRITGSAQQLKLRLACQNCGYQGPILRQEELHDLL